MSRAGTPSAASSADMFRSNSARADGAETGRAGLGAAVAFRVGEDGPTEEWEVVEAYPATRAPTTIKALKAMTQHTSVRLIPTGLRAV